jgi:hypothetical protein
MKIRPGRVAYGRTDMTMMIVAFRNFANVPTNAVVATLCNVCINLCLQGRTKGRASRATVRGATPIREH